MPDNQLPRRRMVVEELNSEEPVTAAAAPPIPTEELTEKVEDLQTITEHIAEDVQESAKVQEEIKEVVEKQQDEFMAPKQAPNFNPLIIIIPGILLLGALLGGIVFYQKMTNSAAVTATPTPNANDQTTTDTTTPTATPAATTTSLTKYSVVIQNGSGISGEAGRAKTLLETAGFKVGSTGNASSYDFTKTIVKVKSTVEADFTAALVKALGKNYTVDKTATLPSTSTDDIQVIVGSLKSGN